MDVLRQLGVDVIRLYMPWNQLAPNPDSRKRPNFNAADPASYSAATWAIYDTIIRDATAKGIGIDLTVGAHVPLWATGANAPPGGPHLQWEPSASEYGQFMRAVGKRYSGSYKPPGALHPAAARQVLGDLERAELRRRPGATGDRQFDRGSVAARCTAGSWTRRGALCTRPGTATTRS